VSDATVALHKLIDSRQVVIVARSDEWRTDNVDVISRAPSSVAKSAQILLICYVVLLNISLGHSRSFETTLLSRACVSSY